MLSNQHPCFLVPKLHFPSQKEESTRGCVLLGMKCSWPTLNVSIRLQLHWCAVVGHRTHLDTMWLSLRCTANTMNGIFCVNKPACSVRKSLSFDCNAAIRWSRITVLAHITSSSNSSFPENLIVWRNFEPSLSLSECVPLPLYLG